MVARHLDYFTCRLCGKRYQNGIEHHCAGATAINLDESLMDENVIQLDAERLTEEQYRMVYDGIVRTQSKATIRTFTEPLTNDIRKAFIEAWTMFGKQYGVKDENPNAIYETADTESDPTKAE